MDTTVVYGPQSIFPRYVDLNLTFDVLGHSFNVLELAYHSVYSESLSNYVYGFRDKYLFSKERSGIDGLPKATEMVSSNFILFLSLFSVYTRPQIFSMTDGAQLTGDRGCQCDCLVATSATTMTLKTLNNWRGSLKHDPFSWESMRPWHSQQSVELSCKSTIY